MKCINCGRDADVKETRVSGEGVMLRRRRVCSHCGTKFSTFEIDDGLMSTIKKYMAAHAAAIKKRQALTRRNEKILAKLRAGEKHITVASEFNLSESMISTIARRAGVPAYQRVRRGQV